MGIFKYKINPITDELDMYEDFTADIAAAVASSNAYADSLVVGLWDDRGNYNASSNIYPTTGGSGTAGAIKKGDTWLITVAGTLPTNQVVEPGDTLRALSDTPGQTQGNWAILQANSTGTIIGNTIYVSTNGSDTLGERNNLAKPFSTLEAAVSAASSGDTIYVYPGTYTITTTATNGIAKSGVNFVFAPGCIINKSSAGDMFNDNGFTLPCNVFAYGSTFSKTGSAGKIYKQYLPNAIFEATTVTNTTSDCFVTYRGDVHFRVDYATSTGGVVLGMAQSNSYSVNKIKIDMIYWKSTAGNVLGGYSWWYYTELTVNGVMMESTAANAVDSMESANGVFNVTKILGTSYGITANDFGGQIAINCVYCTGFQGNGHVKLNGHLQNVVYNAYSHDTLIGGTCSNITVNSGTVDTTVQSYNTSENTNITITGGNANIKIGVSGYGFSLNSTGGVLNINGTLTQLQQSGTKDRIINGGIVNVYAGFVHGGNPDQIKYYMFKLQSGTLRLKSTNMKNAFNDPQAHGIVWSGGTLIVDGVSMYITNAEAYPIQALTAGLNLKVLSGGLSTNKISGLTTAKKKKDKQTVLAISTTSIQLNDNIAGGYETFTVSDTVTYNTAAKIAQQMVALINASATLDITASQDTPGTDVYFYTEADTAGTAYLQQTVVNLTTTTVRENSYALTNITGGTIIEDADVE